jgi:hypothetical protein
MTRASVRHLGFALLATLLLSCASSPDSRIEENQELFDSYPPEVQARLSEGKVAVGDNEDRVYMALGDPNETTVQVTEQGETLMWGYTKSRPGFSIGIGGGGGGYRTGGAGGGVSMGSGPRKDYTAIIDFREGIVTRIRFFTQ